MIVNDVHKTLDDGTGPVPKFLLALQRVFQFVQGLLQLGFDLVEVVDFVFRGLQVFGGLLVDLLHVLLLLVELVDELILVGDLIVQAADLVILGGLVLLGLNQFPNPDSIHANRLPMNPSMTVPSGGPIPSPRCLS